MTVNHQHNELQHFKFRKVKERFFSFGFFFYVLFFLLACQTVNPSFFDKTNRIREDVLQGKWEGTLFFKGIKESFYLKVHFYALKNKKLRIDGMASFSVPIFSFIFLEEDFQLISYREKQYFLGKTKNLKNLKVMNKTSIPLNPIVFHSVLFDRPIREKSWQCKEESTKKSYFQTCQSLKSSWNLKWESLPYGKKRILMSLVEEVKSVDSGKNLKPGENSKVKLKTSLKKESGKMEKIGKMEKVKETLPVRIEIHLNRFFVLDERNKIKSLFKIKELREYQRLYRKGF